MNSQFLIRMGLCFLFGAALGVAPSGAQRPNVHDSAGVMIVSTILGSGMAPEFALGSRPLFEVGGLLEVPTQEFDHNQGYLNATPLAAGGIAVIDVNRVHFFDARGGLMRISGRAGAGPGEFRYLTSICRTRGDTVVVHDSGNNRIGVLDGRGSFVGSIAKGSGSPLDSSTCFGDGTFAVSANTSSGTRSISRLNLRGRVLNRLGEVSPFPFNFVTQHDVSSVAHGNYFYHADPSSHQITIRDVRGKLLRILRFVDPRVPITRAQAEARLASTIPSNVSSTERRERLDRLLAAPVPEHWPTYRGVLVGPGGLLWVQDYQADWMLPSAWSSIDSTGTIRARLVLPPNVAGRGPMQVVAFGNGTVLVRRYDDQNALYLTMFPLVARARSD